MENQINAAQVLADYQYMVKFGRDLTGKHFNYWTVIRFSHRKQVDFWWCRCRCGAERPVNGSSLRTGVGTSCGCVKMDRHSLFGIRFVRLTVCARDLVSGVKFWKCRCECGKIVSVMRGALTSGNSKSCGCLNLELIAKRSFRHGACLNPLMRRTYRIWAAMIQRCTNKKQLTYLNYGARGIRISKRWFKFVNFFADMGVCPDSMSLGRIDNNSGYSKENCRWETIWEQASNRRNNNKITYLGETLIVTEWARRTGISRLLIASRKKRGWTPERILTTPSPVSLRRP